MSQTQNAVRSTQPAARPVVTQQTVTLDRALEMVRYEHHTVLAGTVGPVLDAALTQVSGESDLAAAIAHAVVHVAAQRQAPELLHKVAIALFEAVGAAG